MIVLMMLIGAGIVYWLLQFLYSKYWDKNLEAEIGFSTDHVVKGEETELIEIITNNKRLPLPYIHVKFQLDKSIVFKETDSNSAISDRAYRNDIFSLLFYQKVTRRIPVKCTKRGVYKIDRVDMISTGVFMNEVLANYHMTDTEITVYPTMADTDRLEIPFQKIMGTIEKNKYLYEDKFVFRGIRDYEIYDAMNTVNWKASARSGNLMVNQYNETTCQEVCVLLNLEQEGMLRYDLLSEEGISIAAGIAQMLSEQGVLTSFISNGRDFDTEESIVLSSGSGISHLQGINTALARIGLGKEPEDFQTVFSNTELQHSEHTLYIMISANRRRELQESFWQLCGQNTDCMWVLPYHNGMDTDLDYCGVHKVLWEVDNNDQ